MSLEQKLLALADQVGADIGELQRANEAFMSDTDVEVAKRWPRNQQWAAGSFTRWAFAVSADLGSLDALTLDLDNVPNVKTFGLRLWLRPVGSTSVTGPSEGQGDTLAREHTYAAADFPQVATHQPITFRFPEFTAPAGQWLMFELYGLKTDDTPANIGIGRLDGVTGITQYERGYYMTTGPGWALVPASGATPTIAFIASIRGKVLDGSQFVNLPRPDTDPLSVLVSTPDDIDLRYEGLAVTAAGRVLRDRTAVDIGTTISVAAAATGTTTSTVSLVYATTDAFVLNNANVWLGRRNISNVVVKRSSDAVTLVEGVDYSVNYSNGKLRGLINKAAFNVDVTFDWAQERYDLLQLDEQTNVLSIKAGTPRDFDPQEYLVAPDASKIPVARVRVVGTGVREIIPVYEFDGLIERGTEAEWYRLQQRNRFAIRKTLRKLARGERIKVAGYGDSITAFQTGAPTDGSQYQANGQWRDRDQYFVLYPSDTKTAKLQYFDTGDGAGAVHIRKGWNWTLVEHWRQAYGDIVDYLNFGIGSTASANVANGGLWPARLAPIISAAPDLCVIAFGMNELGQYVTRDNVASIITQLQAAGTECVVVGVPQIAPDNATTADMWRITNHALRMAAWDTGCAYVPFTAISDTDGGLAGLGLSKKHVAASNLYNHPGFYELEKYGELLIFALGEKDAAGGMQTIATTPATTSNDKSIATTEFVRAVLALYGLGGTAAPSVPGGDIDSTSIPSGTYRMVATDVGVKPSGITDGVIRVDRYNATDSVQTLEWINPARVFARASVAGVWGAWREAWNSLNLPKQTGPNDATTGAAVMAEHFAVRMGALGAPINLMRDSGRFGGAISPQSLYVPATFANATGFLSPYNGGAWADAGQFYHDNGTNGGARGTLSQDVIDFLTAAGRTGNAARYGVEFRIGTLTQGSGTVVPSVGPDGVTRYLSVVNNSQPIAGPGAKATFSGWIRAKTGSVHLIASGVDLFINGVLTPSNYVLPANTWVHFRQIAAAPYGYDNGFPRVYATPGAQVQFALPAFFSGEVDTGRHTAPIGYLPALQVLGVVAQISGEMTGAIIERGSNANGEYVRFADGTQICTHAVTANDIAHGGTGSVVWNFPAAFVASPKVDGDSGTSQPRFYKVSSLSLGGGLSATVYITNDSGSTTSRTAQMTAIGRWY